MHRHQNATLRGALTLPKRRYLDHGPHGQLKRRDLDDPVNHGATATATHHRVTNDAPERLIISYEATTPSVFSLRDATRGLCEIIWMIDLSEPQMANSARLLSRVGQVVDIAGLTDEQTVEALAASEPTGIVALNDRRMTRLAMVAESLHLRFHSPEVAARLSDKLLQRRAMQVAGIPGPPFWEVPARLSNQEADAAGTGGFATRGPEAPFR